MPLAAAGGQVHDTPRWRRHLAVAAGLAALAAALLAVGTGALVGPQPDSTRPTPGPAAAPSRAVPTPTGRTVQQRLPALRAFVEQERGLSFRRDVEVELLDDDDFDDELRDAEPLPDAADGDDDAPTLTALGLAEDEDALDDTLAAAAEGVDGFYDEIDDRIVLREQEVGPYLDAVLVHELTHALQDQHFGLFREGPAYDEEADAFAALVEGDAARVEHAWYERQPSEVRARLHEIAGYDEEAVLPEDPVEAALAFPYVAGPRLVDALLAQGGQQRLDEAFRSPPVTLAQVLHPERVGEGPPVAMRVPPGQGRRVDEGVLGELGLALLLGNDPLEPGGAQESWRADRYGTYQTRDRTCTVADVETDAAGRAGLVQALSEADVPARPLGETRVRLQRCA